MRRTYLAYLIKTKYPCLSQLFILEKLEMKKLILKLLILLIKNIFLGDNTQKSIFLYGRVETQYLFQDLNASALVRDSFYPTTALTVTHTIPKLVSQLSKYLRTVIFEVTLTISTPKNFYFNILKN